MRAQNATLALCFACTVAAVEGASYFALLDAETRIVREDGGPERVGSNPVSRMAVDRE